MTTLTEVNPADLNEGDTFVHPGYAQAAKAGDTIEQWTVRFFKLDGFVWYDELGSAEFSGRWGLDVETVQVAR